MEERKIIVVDDDPSSLSAISRALSNYHILKCKNGKEALETLANGEADLLITDLKLPDIDGLELIKRAKDLDEDMKVIMITGYGTVESAVSAMKLGADDYILKPVDLFELRKRVEKLINEKTLKRELSFLREEVAKKYDFEGIVGKSKKMQEIYEKILKIAPTNSNVLIVGESGTGKELVARAIHAKSKRADKPFIPINCAAIPEGTLESELFGHEKGAFTGAYGRQIGKFELANGGTLFLDEIAEIPTSIQAKLLRAIEQKEIMRVGGEKIIKVDVRLIFATNRNLEKELEEKRIREDFYYRIKGLVLEIPPLRERKEDIPILFELFLERFKKETGRDIRDFDKSIIDIFTHYNWPGNVRELKNVVENMVVMAKGDKLSEEDVPSYIKERLKIFSEKEPTFKLKVGMSMDEIEKEVIKKTLDFVGGNRTKAAKILKIGLRTLHRKIKKL